MEEQTPFQRTLRAARAGASQREFALRIGATEKVVSRWERGICVPRGVGVRTALARAGVILPEMGRAASEQADV